MSAEPTFAHVQPGEDAVAQNALRFAELVGVDLSEWQTMVLRDWLLTNPDTGNWVHRSGCLILPRQGGKSSLLAVRLLFGLFMLPQEENLLHTAHRFQTAGGLFTDMIGMIESCQLLRKRTRRILTGTGNQQIETKEGHCLFVQSRTNTMSGGSRGRSFDVVTLDEALILDREGPYLSGLLPTLSARPNPQLLYASSGGDADSTQLAAVRKAGYDQTPGMCLHEWAADADDDHSSDAVVAKTNPDYPLRPTPEAVTQERSTLTPSQFARERLGIWSTGAPEPALNWDSWSGCLVDTVGFPGPGMATLAVDVSIATGGERTAALTVAWRADEGKVMSLLVKTAGGTTWVPAKALEVAERFGLSSVRFCPGGAQDLADSLVASGLEVDRVPFPATRGAASRMAEMLSEDILRVQHSEALNTAARTVPRRKGMDGLWGFSSNGPTPGCTLIALSLAAVAAETVEEPEPAIW